MAKRPVPSRIGRTPVQSAALTVGALFLLIGVAGFIPGVTANYDQLEFAGPESQAMLLGIFQVSWLHNLVHMAFGVAGLALALNMTLATGYLIAGGALYLLAWLYGLVVDAMDVANYLPVNNADNWLHLVLALGMVGLGAALGARSRAASVRRSGRAAAG